MNNYKEFVWPDFTNYIRSIFDEHIYKYSKPNFGDTVRCIKIEDITHTKINDLYDKFCFLGGDILVLTHKPNSFSNIHIDGEVGQTYRKLALVIGIQNTLESTTEFFNTSTDDYQLIKNIDNPSYQSRTFDINNCIKIDEYCLLEYPILINTQVPHRINNKNNGTRISLSWTIDPELSWEQAIERIEYHRIHTQIN